VEYFLFSYTWRSIGAVAVVKAVMLPGSVVDVVVVGGGGGN